jgi:hypothetical protein
MKVFNCLMVLTLLSVGLLGCRDDSASTGSNASVVYSPTNYDNGVVYFSCVGAEFAHSLSVYLSSHQNLKVEAMCGDGIDCGYFVVFGPK